MKAIKSQSVQTLLIGFFTCGLMAYLSSLLDFEISDTVISLFAGGFVALVTGNKVRDSVQANKGLYYHEDDKTLKKAE